MGIAGVAEEPGAYFGAGGEIAHPSADPAGVAASRDVFWSNARPLQFFGEFVGLAPLPSVCQKLRLMVAKADNHPTARLLGLRLEGTEHGDGWNRLIEFIDHVAGQDKNRLATGPDDRLRSPRDGGDQFLRRQELEHSVTIAMHVTQGV